MDFEFIFRIVQIALYAILCVVTYVRTGSLKTVVSTLNKEVFDMKTVRSPNYRADSDNLGFTPDNFRTEYSLNAHTHELEELPERTDLAELIKSSLDTCFEAALKRLLPDPEQTELDVQDEYSQSISDLDALVEAFNVADEWRERLGLEDTTSVDEVYKAMAKKSSELRLTLSNVNKLKSVTSAVKDEISNLEVLKNEKTPDTSKGVEQNVQENGKESAQA